MRSFFFRKGREASEIYRASHNISFTTLPGLRNPALLAGLACGHTFYYLKD